MTILAALFGTKQEHTGLSDCKTQHYVMSAFLLAMFAHYQQNGVSFQQLS